MRRQFSNNTGCNLVIECASKKDKLHKCFDSGIDNYDCSAKLFKGVKCCPEQMCSSLENVSMYSLFSRN